MFMFAAYINGGMYGDLMYLYFNYLLCCLQARQEEEFAERNKHQAPAGLDEEDVEFLEALVSP